MRVLTAVLLTLVVAGCGNNEPPPLIAQLQQGGNVIVMRHALTESTTPPRESLRSCDSQRNLSRAGRTQAAEIGADLRALDVPIAEVRASPLCRTRETAELAFGRATLDRDLISPGVIGTIADDERRAGALRETIRAAPEGNLVLVTHTGNIGALGKSVLEGEMLVYRDGRLSGRLTPDDLAAAARRR